MWFVYIFISAFFSSLATVFVKLGVRSMDTTLATAVKTVVVALIAWAVVFLRGTAADVHAISRHTMLFLILSGLTTGGCWLCDYSALKHGDVDTTMAVSRCSMVASVVLAFLLLGDPFGAWSVFGTILIFGGSLLMVEKKNRGERQRLDRVWWISIVLGVIFSSTTTILGKIGIAGVDSNLGTAIHSLVVLLMTGGMATLTGKWKQVREVPRQELGFLLLSGVASAVTWLTYYRGLQMQYASVVAPTDKLLAGMITALMAWVVFHEKIDRCAALALGCIGVGTVIIVL